MAAVVRGRVDWSSTRTEEGHRSHKVVWLVESLTSDGPMDVYFATGLPTVGSTWIYGNTNDPWAFLTPAWTVSPVLKGEKNRHWTVEQTFTTIPRRRCQDTSVDNPMDEPPDVSGSFVKYTKEALVDRFGNPLLTSSHERFKGVERDFNRPTISITKNFTTLPLALFAAMVDTVNDAPLWGLPARTIKLSNTPWSRKVYGGCSFYYTVTYEFDVVYETHDKRLLDEGNKVLKPGGDKDKPQDFMVYKDVNGENARVLLNGDGKALEDDDDPFYFTAELYDESNFLLLDIPTSL